MYLFRSVKGDVKSIIFGPEVNTGFIIKHPKNIKIGTGTVINGNCLWNGYGNLTMGKYCHIAAGSTTYTRNHDWKSNDHILYGKKNSY
jgi:acetyltransferase-like isoleucine patch superfamily enzyme